MSVVFINIVQTSIYVIIQSILGINTSARPCLNSLYSKDGPTLKTKHREVSRDDYKGTIETNKKLVSYLIA